MAIVFVPIKKKKRIFMRIITMSLIFILFAISLIVFPPQFKNEPGISDSPTPDYGDTGIKINFEALDSRQVKSLEPFSGVKKQFSYVAYDKSGKEKRGKVLSDSKESAQKILEAVGLRVINIEGPDSRKNNPFSY